MNVRELLDNDADEFKPGSPSRRPRWNEPVVGLTDVKVQHYNPQMYLRGFAGSDRRIRRVDLDTGASIRTNPKNVGAETGFNNFRFEDSELSSEGWLSDVEGIASPLLGRLLADPQELLVFTEDEQMLFARFLATHRFRVPAFRAQMDAMRARTLGFVKETGRAWLWNQHKGDEATAAKIWKEWEQRHEEWWMHERPFDAAELTAKMFMEVQGYANLLWSMPWRIGRVPPHIRLYTSDNPLQGYLQPVRPWWESGAFGSMSYYVPLSPSVLLRISPVNRRPEDAQVGDPGARVAGLMSGWDAAMAMQIQSALATRYLYGDGPFLGRDEARAALADYEMRAITTAKAALNWSGDEPPTTELPGGGQGTPVPVSPSLNTIAPARQFSSSIRVRSNCC